jgi:molybdopterin molybdotransferase
MFKIRRNLSLAQAQALVRGEAPLVGTESIDLTAGLHRIIRQDLISRRAYPAADVAERDGFCFPAAATLGASRKHPAVFDLRGSLNAGDRPALETAGGDCVRIMTGAVLPEGADTVLAGEDALVRNGCLVILQPMKSGTHVRRAGSAIRVGDKVAAVGDVLSTGRMGLLAACGIRRVRVARRVRIGMIPTGDEIVDAGTHARPWQVYSSNAMVLSGQAGELGAEVFDLGIAADRRGEIVDRLGAGRRCDIIVLTGGSSTGSCDLVLDALETYGCRILTRGIQLRPGRHMILARRGRQVLFGLPGRPAGCFALFHVLVRPAVLAMMGSADYLPMRIRAVWGGGTGERPAIDTLVAARLDGNGIVRPDGDTRCGDLPGLARANALAHIRSGRGLLKRGERVDVYPVRGCLA